MYHDIPYDAGQRQATYPIQLWNHQDKQEGALQGTILPIFGEYGHLIKYIRQQALYYETSVGLDDFAWLWANLCVFEFVLDR